MKHPKVIAFTRNLINEGLKQIDNPNHIDKFKRMYSHDNLDRPLDEIVENMSPDKLEFALTQIENTIEKK